MIPLFLAAIFSADASRPATIGSTVNAASIRFKDIRYLERTLDDFGPRKATVLVFVNNDCPLVRRYFPVLRDLEMEYRRKGVVFAAVNVGGGDSILEMARQPIDFDLPFPFVKDIGGKVAAYLGATRTPEAIVLDQKNVLRYRGRIDDQHRLGGSLPQPTQTSLADALDAVLTNRPVATSETPADGCLIATAAPRKHPVNADTAASLVQKNCVECHTSGGPAPFALDSLETIRSHAATIAEVVVDGRMPPWYGSASQRFRNHRGLNAEERDTVKAWIDAGAPAPKETVLKPIPPTLTDGWEIGKPDRVITMIGKHSIPATGLVDYKYVVLPAVFTEDVWVEGVEIHASNPRVLHHCNAGYAELGGDVRRPTFITGKVPGGQAMTLRDGTAFCIPKGAVLGLQAHYTTTGKPEECVLSIGLKYAKQVKHRLRHLEIAAHRFSIPAGDPFYKLTASRKLPCNALGVGMFCHMHTRGRDMTFIAHEPGKPPQELLCIPTYNFDWQQAYEYDLRNPKRLAKGTRIECVAHYDNSRFNPYNPDPNRIVPEGQQTKDEMMYGFFFYIDADEKLDLVINPRTGTVKKSLAPPQQAASESINRARP
jgi:mono/diheme cytochrome c family protein/thiol-disulfide isomerase/thioredoxin